MTRPTPELERLRREVRVAAMITKILPTCRKCGARLVSTKAMKAPSRLFVSAAMVEEVIRRERREVRRLRSALKQIAASYFCDCDTDGATCGCAETVAARALRKERKR